MLPVRRNAIIGPEMVITGTIAFFIICTMEILALLIPLALAIMV